MPVRTVGRQLELNGEEPIRPRQKYRLLKSAGGTLPFLLLVSTLCLAVTLQGRGQLRVMENQRYLEYEDGTPFFYLGDTAWELFHRLNREEATRYLKDRAAKGFTVIQAVILAPFGGLEVPNPYGDLPLIANDPTRPNPEYFEHVDYIVREANDRGLMVGMLPTWGDKWKQTGEDRSRIFNPENAFSYGRFLGKRYLHRQIIWILGGDENIQSRGERLIIDALAEGLREGDEGKHLITYHPRGPGHSSDQLHHATWLDFNMFQSSHASHDHDTGLFVERDYRLAPAKPTLDGEPRYETIPVGFYFEGANRLDRFDDFDVRQAAYWAVLSGACGHTYGNNNVWQMWQQDRQPAIGANVPWYEALDHPGAFQMGLLRRLFESRPFWKLKPAQEIILDGPQEGGSKIRAALAEDRSFAFVYSPYGKSFTIDKRAVEGRPIRESWFDPRYGVAYSVHAGETVAAQTYTPPTSGRGQDWILVLEDASRNFAELGGPLQK